MCRGNESMVFLNLWIGIPFDTVPNSVFAAPTCWHVSTRHLNGICSRIFYLFSVLHQAYGRSYVRHLFAVYPLQIPSKCRRRLTGKSQKLSPREGDRSGAGHVNLLIDNDRMPSQRGNYKNSPCNKDICYDQYSVSSYSRDNELHSRLPSLG